MHKTVAVNEAGLRIGEDHQRARLTDHEIELLLALRDEGWGYGRLAEKFEISKSHARGICRGKCRCQCAAGWKTVHLPET
jgi:hypothetical protein